MYCTKCGAQVAKDATFCTNCGEQARQTININATTNQTKIKVKKTFYQKAWFWILIVFTIIIFIGIVGRNNNNNNISQTFYNNVSQNKGKQDSSKIIYEDKEFLVKIVNYEYLKITNTIKVNIYIENNSDIDTTFTIDGDVSVNDIMVEGGYLYQEVNAKTKANTSFKLSNLKVNGINEENLSKMQFKLDIYQSKNYTINKRIVDDLKVNYEF